MSGMRGLPAAVFIIMVLVIGCVKSSTVDVAASSTAGYWDSSLCRNCHERAYDEYIISRHSQSYTNELFQAQYFNEIVPKALEDPNVMDEARRCMACHNPVAYMTLDEPILKKKDGEIYANNVTCDFCHTVSGIEGKKPGNANYVSSPGEKKYGPHRVDTEWHHIYSPLYAKSALCGACHNGHNHAGFEIKTTYSEWAESIYARKDIQCQDCHMNLLGYLSGDTPIFDAGPAAHMQIVKPPHRKNLHTHKFPGSYSTNQITGAIKIDLKVNRREVSPGEKIDAMVSIDNRRSGHKMPTGSTEMRVMWLELKYQAGGEDVLISAKPYNNGAKASYEVAGALESDKRVLNSDIPVGCRVYRQVFLDKDGKHTMRSYEARSSAFDNRLEAAEQRSEEYEFRVPKMKGSLRVIATLYYMAYPDTVAKELGVSEAKVIKVSSDSMDLLVR